MTKYQEMWCRADAPSNKGVYSTSFVGQETLSLPKPDVNLSGQRQTATLTHTRTHRMHEIRVIVVHRYNVHLRCIKVFSSPSYPSGMYLIENMMFPRLLMESGLR